MNLFFHYGGSVSFNWKMWEKKKTPLQLKTFLRGYASPYIENNYSTYETVVETHAAPPPTPLSLYHR